MDTSARALPVLMPRNHVHKYTIFSPIGVSDNTNWYFAEVIGQDLNEISFTRINF